VDSNTRDRLIQLNHQFYQTFAQHFAVTRQRLQPGVKRVIARLPPVARLLDLGCGNGELYRVLARLGFLGLYTGLDFSDELLRIAAERNLFSSKQSDGKQVSSPDDSRQGIFLQADLSSADWDANLPVQVYDTVLAFAALHHLPSYALRLQTLRKVHRLLAQGGNFIHSEWQFLSSPRLRLRIQPWETIGLSEEEVEPGDYLLDWRSGGYGLRYVHHFSQDELSLLAEQSGFQIVETFLSDGENSRLSLYQCWSPTFSNSMIP
jgi:SAM-dependent methyltransferase